MSERFNLLIIDVMMPGLNGIQPFKHLREKALQTPILMLTAMGTVDDKVTDLETGADDYLVKPFHLRELLARVTALLRRQPPIETQTELKLFFEDLILDTYQQRPFC